LAGIEDYMRKNKINDIAQLRGSLQK